MGISLAHHWPNSMQWLAVCQTTSVCNNPITCTARILARAFCVYLCSDVTQTAILNWAPFGRWTPGNACLLAEPTFCAFGNALCGKSHGVSYINPIVPIAVNPHCMTYVWLITINIGHTHTGGPIWCWGVIPSGLTPHQDDSDIRQVRTRPYSTLRTTALHQGDGPPGQCLLARWTRTFCAFGKKCIVIGTESPPALVTSYHIILYVCTPCRKPADGLGNV